MQELHGLRCRKLTPAVVKRNRMNTVGVNNSEIVVERVFWIGTRSTVRVSKLDTKA